MLSDALIPLLAPEYLESLPVPNTPLTPLHPQNGLPTPLHLLGTPNAPIPFWPLST